MAAKQHTILLVGDDDDEFIDFGSFSQSLPISHVDGRRDVEELESSPCNRSKLLNTKSTRKHRMKLIKFVSCLYHRSSVSKTRGEQNGHKAIQFLLNDARGIFT